MLPSKRNKGLQIFALPPTWQPVPGWTPMLDDVGKIIPFPGL